MRTVQSLTAACCALLMLAPPTFAQNQGGSNQPISDAGGGWFRGFNRRYSMAEVSPINLTNSSRLESLIRAGRVYLSLQDAIALALENNLDIELQRYGPRIAEAELLRARAGGVLRGIPTTVQSGPTSAVNLQTGGGGSGIQSSGGGGAASSTSGAIISFTGTQIPQLDESIYAQYTYGNRRSPNANTLTTGVSALQFTTNNYAFGIQKSFLTGTSINTGYSSTGQRSNNRVSDINPLTNANLNWEVRQRLLQGFGVAVNSRNIRIAKKEVEISDLVFKQQVIETVSAIINLYFDLVSFNEDVKVRAQAVALNEKLYSDNKKQVEIGTLAPIEIVRAEAEVARSQQELTASETQLLQQETIIKNALSRTGVSNPLLAEARIVPTDKLRIPDVEAVSPIQDLVELAIQNRPEILQTRLNIDIAKVSLLGSKSALLPSFDLIAEGQNPGLVGSLNTLPPPPNFTRNPNAVDPLFLGGSGTLLNQIFGANFPNYSVGFQLNIPIRNRSAQADVIRDQLTLRQAEIRQRQQLNSVRVNVQNALIGMQQARARYQAALKSRVLQEQTLDAEQKKYALGASTIFNVIFAQRDLAQAQAAEVAALSNYNRNRVALDNATGQTLASNSIMLEEALKGQVKRGPSAIPELDPR